MTKKWNSKAAFFFFLLSLFLSVSVSAEWTIIILMLSPLLLLDNCSLILQTLKIRKWLVILFMTFAQMKRSNNPSTCQDTGLSSVKNLSVWRWSHITGNWVWGDDRTWKNCQVFFSKKCFVLPKKNPSLNHDDGSERVNCLKGLKITR